MKKICLLALGLIVSGATLRAQTTDAPKVIEYREIGAPLPELRVIDTKNKEYTAESFKNNNHFFLFMFNPTCGHCIDMAKLVSTNLSVFSQNHILFLAGAQMMSYLDFFYKETELEKYPAIKVGVDSAKAVDKMYSYNTLPQINIYDKDRKLVKIFYGDTPLDSLKKYVP